MKKHFLYLLIVQIFLISICSAAILENLSLKHRKELINKGYLNLSHKLEGSSWDELRMYRIVNLKPRIIAAVWADYRNHKKWFTNVLKSEETQGKKPTNPTEIYYRYDLPAIIGDAKINVSCTVSSYKHQGKKGYRFKTHLIEGSKISEIKIDVQIENYKGKSIIYVSGKVWPSSFLAGLFESKYQKQTLTIIKDAIKMAYHIYNKEESLLIWQIINLKKILRK